MKCIKRLGALFVALCLMATMIPAAFAAQATGAITLTIGSPTMSVNGTATTIDAEGSRATLYQGNTMLPLRSVVENMGGTVAWDAATKKITLKYNGSTVTMTLSEKTAYANGVAKSMTVAPFTDNGRTYVWLRSLEFFPGVTVDWRADTRQATVVYPMVAGSTLATQPLQLKITNTSTAIYTALRLAPAGTEDWGDNLISSTLYANGSTTVNAKVAKVKYDLQLTGYYGYKSYIRNLDFTNAGTYGSLNITSADKATLILDGVLASGTDASVRLTVQNNTANIITSIVYAPAGSTKWSDEQLATHYLARGGYATMVLPYSSSSPYYDFRVTYQSGWQVTYQNVNLASTWGTQMITLNANGQVTYANSTSTGTTTGKTEITFKNSYGKTVYELRMALSNTDSAFRNAENLIDTTKNGDTDKFTFDLTGMRKWYVRAYDKDGDVIESGSITFSSTSPKTATVTLKRSGDFVLGSASSADTGLLISNMSDENIYAIFAVDPEDIKDYDDYDEFNDDYDDLGSLDIGEYDVFDLDLYGSSDHEVSLVLFYDDPDEDDDAFVTKTISFNKNISDIGVVCVTDIGTSTFTCTPYDDGKYDLNDGELVFSVYNSDKSAKVDEIYVRDADYGDEDDDSDRDFDSDDLLGSSIAAKSGDSWIISDDEYGDDGYCDILFVFSDGTRVVLDDVDTTDYNYFVQVIVDTKGADIDGE